MGQYYKPCVLSHDKKEVVASIYSHALDNGLKLMEHSYINNELVSAFESLIDDDNFGQFCGYPVVWCGDYADPLSWTKRIEKDDKGNNIVVKDNYYELAKDEVTWGENNFNNSFDIDKTVHRRYIINHDKKQYVDTEFAQEIKGWNGTKIHSLPLLICSGNGRGGGGGDYQGINMKYVGIWKHNIVVVSDYIPEGYTELRVRFMEKF